jgi:hypothetical protein
MKQDTETQKAQRLLQKALDLKHINDPTLLKIEIDRKLKSLNKIEMIELEMKLGTMQQELEAGQGFQDQKPKAFIITMIIFLGMSIASFWLLFSFNLYILWKIILWPNAIVCGMLGLRTLYNLINGKYRN